LRLASGPNHVHSTFGGGSLARSRLRIAGPLLGAAVAASTLKVQEAQPGPPAQPGPS